MEGGTRGSGPGAVARRLRRVWTIVPAAAAVAALMAATAVVTAGKAAAQTAGTVSGRVVVAGTAQPVAGAEVTIQPLGRRTLTAEDGRFVLAAVPTGEWSLRVERLGYRPVVLERVVVRAGRPTELEIEVEETAVALPGVTVSAEQVRLVEPEVAVTRDVVVGRGLRELPLDRLQDAIELAPGVSDGHFRGGRVGQEAYVVDGIELKNQLEGSMHGFGLEFSPTSLEEVEVVTSGFGAEYGSALSGVVNLVTRRGSTERWEGRASLLTDHWAPDGLFRGFTGLSASAGGPLRALGTGTTLFADLLLQGMLDAEPRARGLTCLRPEDVGDSLAVQIRALRDDPLTRHLYCPYTAPRLPHQRGDKLIGFIRLDRPLSGGAILTASVLRNRLQRELYTQEFKYNPRHQLGQRTTGTLGTLALDLTRHRQGRAYRVTARAAFMRLDRYLGVLDRSSVDGRFEVAGFGPGRFRFLGEDVMLRQGATWTDPVPGYSAPGGEAGSPFGPGGYGLFFTRGTPPIANWTSTRMVGADLVGEAFSAGGVAVRGGLMARLYGIRALERVRAHEAGVAPIYNEFDPATLSGFAEVQVVTGDLHARAGVRVEAFRSGLDLTHDPDGGGPRVLTPGWKHSIMPRLGVALPVTAQTSFRANFGWVAQPPDFRYFMDTTLGDSLRTDIHRQGNPDLGFERGTAYEIGVSHSIGENTGVAATLFRKRLHELVSGSVAQEGGVIGRFELGDFGNVNGLELSVRAQWRGLLLRGGYALQKATGVTSTALSDPLADTSNVRVEFPLAFDRRHSMDLAVYAGRAAGRVETRWSAALRGRINSGYPLDRRLAGGSFNEFAYLPWTAGLDARVSRELGTLPGCDRCAWRVIADGRNVLGRHNIVGLRRETASLAPELARLREIAAEPMPGGEPIPWESPFYSRYADLDGDRMISAEEYATARFAAALDRFDPSLFFGEPRQIRVGVEVAF
nr:MAG: hypothetical protein DIU52_07800 [bacterium]